LERDEPVAMYLSGKALVKLGQRYEGTQRVKRAYEKEQNPEFKEYLDQLDREMYGPKYG
jgi:hypothetical protein